MVQEIRKSDMSPPASAGPHQTDIFSAMRREMDRVFDQFMTGGLRWPMPFQAAGGDTHMPDVDIRETATEMVLEAELPGIEEKDVAVTYADGILTIKGEKRTERDEKKDDYHLTERSFGSFQRAFRLPETVDDASIAASFDKGVLCIRIAKKPTAERKEKTIPIGKG
ncbi:MAG TPA: Hsp20/alpha crystallin family protein [Hyphomicrobiaceae bacterium]|nr:Hsp20/alpha crystallin family protein [Hyphomicrobiaceae bacterium]